MPVYKKKRYAVKRRPSRKAPKRAPAVSIQSLLQGAAVGYLKRRLGLNTEEKFLDVNSGTTATTSLVQNIVMPTIPQGLTDNDRTGSNLRITRIDTRIVICAAATSTIPMAVRIIQVRHTEQGLPTAGEILEVTTRLVSPINVKAKAFGIQVLKDITVPVDSFGGGSPTIVEWTHSGANDQVAYTTSDTTGVPTNVISGHISTWWMLEENFSVAPTFSGTSRVYYVDN